MTREEALLQEEYNTCTANLAFLEKILQADKPEFLELYKTVQPGRFDCWGAYKALDAIGGKWKHPILMQLFMNGRMRYTQLKKALQDDGITDNSLSASLKSLLQDALISKTVFPEVPVRVEYQITDKAYELWRIMLQLSYWYNSYDKLALEQKLADADAAVQAAPSANKNAAR